MSTVASERYGIAPAPGGLALVQELLNTIGAGRPRQPDLLDQVQDAQPWLDAAVASWAEATGADQMPDVSLSERDLPRLRALRDRLRRALQQHSAPGPEPAGALRLSMSTDGRLQARPQGRGAQWVTSAVLGELYDAQRNDTRRRLKICRNEMCSTAFYDHSRNNSGVWHDVRVCGNAANLRASRARRKQSPASGGA